MSSKNREIAFHIKPLEWNGDKDGNGCGASTPFGNYRVEQMEGTHSFRWSYCFDEYYDEDSFDCETIEAGRVAAEEHWINRISQSLIAAAHESALVRELEQARARVGELETSIAAAVAAEREACKKACQAIADDRIAKYQGKAPYTYYNIEHCNESTYGEAEGANACVDAIAARNEKPTGGNNEL